MSELGCDVLVVGGGIAGVSVAALAAAERTVILVEAEAELSEHSTGRSAAAYLPSYGTDLVRALTAASRADYDALSESAGVPLLTPRPLLWLARDDRGAAQLTTLSGLMPDLEALASRDAEKLCPILRPDAICGGLLDTAAADIDVAALHASYVALLRARGGQVLRSAPLRSAARTAGGWRVHCGDHTVTCDVIVDAAGAWADEVATACGIDRIGVTPCRRSAFIVPLPAASPCCRDWPLVIDSGAGCYFRPEGTAQLLASPGDETPVGPGDARPDELAIAQALDTINEMVNVRLRRVTHAWAGLRTFVPDHEPVVGPAPADPSFIFVAGQGGYGIQMAPAVAALATQVLGVSGAASPDLSAVRPLAAPRAAC